MPETVIPPAQATTSTDINGIANIDDSVFLPEAQDSEPAAPDSPADNAQTQPAQTTDTTQQATTQATTQPTQPDTQQAKTDTGKSAAPTTQTGVQPLLAGNFKTVEELRNAFQDLGGDPSKYTTPQSLEEAYSARRSEFTRARQDEMARIQQMQKDITEKLAQGYKPPEPKQPDKPQFDLEKFTQETISKVQFKENMTMQEYAQQLIKALVPGIQSMMPQVPEQKELDGQTLFQKIAPVLQEYQEQQQAAKQTLTEIEKEVPRLTTDTKFRNLFALHLQNGKYGRDLPGMRSAMKDFMEVIGQPAQAAPVQTQEKQTAAPAPEQTSTKSTGKGGQQVDDEVAGILEAFQSDRTRLGY